MGLLSLLLPTKVIKMSRGWTRFLSNWSGCQLICPQSSHYLINYKHSAQQMANAQPLISDQDNVSMPLIEDKKRGN